LLRLCNHKANGRHHLAQICTLPPATFASPCCSTVAEAEDVSAPVLASLVRASFHRRHDMKREESGAIEKEGVAPSFRSAFSLREKRKRNADRRGDEPSALLARQRVHRHALACRRSTSGVFLEMSEHLRPASGHASWDAAATISSLDGRYPPLPVPVQCAPHGRPGLPAADAQSRPGAMCEIARGHRPRSHPRHAAAGGPS
jgi:hypothetical protein